MNKKIILVSSLALASLMVLPLTGASFRSAKAEGENVYHVDFFNNYLRQDAVLSSGAKIKGNNMLYTTVDVTENGLITKPQDPSRKNYEFQGWYLEAEKQTNAWNFESDVVTKDVRLFAKWALSEKEDVVEPTYTPPSTVLEESAATDYVISSIMNFEIKAGSVRFPRAALMKIEANKENVLPLMEYKVKAGKNISAVFDSLSSQITVTCGENVETINVVDDTTRYKVSNDTYESKALKYEQNALEENSYHVMLAGSSSIEYWDTSKEDLEPIVSYNHGIGGTTVEEWSTKLNQRLVYPYKPKMVVYYVGINNVINSKEDAETIKSRLEGLFDETHQAMPNTKVIYILMNYLPSYGGYKSIISSVNKSVIMYQTKDNNSSWFSYVNPGDLLLKENGEPDAAYFRTDGLHLSRYGYTIWGGAIKEAILEGLEEMSN